MDVSHRYCGACHRFHQDATREPPIADPASEIARLREQLADVMRAGDLEHARMAALIEACEATAAFIESYAPDDTLAVRFPTFYANLRVCGKNARAAVSAVRVQADAMVAELAAARAVVDAVGARDRRAIEDTLIAYYEATKARIE
jgi:DNA-binding FadR family transcriptional regulator